MTTREPEWDAESRQWAMALEFVDDLLCPRCGLPMKVCQDPDNDGLFNVEAPIRCHAQTAVTYAQKKYESDATQAPEALIWTQPTLRRRRIGSAPKRPEQGSQTQG